MSTPHCTWCLNGSRKAEVHGGNVVLFACVREHMTAYPLCDGCAGKTSIGAIFQCKECAAVVADEDDAVCEIVLLTTRADWMERLADGRVRFAVRQ